MPPGRRATSRSVEKDHGIPSLSQPVFFFLEIKWTKPRLLLQITFFVPAHSHYTKTQNPKPATARRFAAMARAEQNGAPFPFLAFQTMPARERSSSWDLAAKSLTEQIKNNKQGTTKQQTRIEYDATKFPHKKKEKQRRVKRTHDGRDRSTKRGEAQNNTIPEECLGLEA